MKFRWTLLGLCLISSCVFADTLYQADVGGYSTNVGVGLGFGLEASNVPYSSLGVATNTYGGYAYSGNTSAIPSDHFNYPYGSSCCGCNRCNNCDTGYGTPCR